MFSFLRKTKIKKSQSNINEDKENNAYDYSLSSAPTIAHDTNLTNDKIHVDVTQNSYDKSLILYDSIEASPRDLSSSSPPYKTCLTHTISPTTSSQVGRSDLNRVLTSGYLNGEQNMGYMKRGGSDHIATSTKSPQFHRPIGFSYNRTQTFTVPGTKKGMKALVTASTKIRKIHCSASPSVSTLSNHESGVEKEPIVLSRYSGGFIPDPTAPKKIESLDWPAPIAMQAVPELMKSYRSRSESRSNHNEISHKTVTTISPTHDQYISNETFDNTDDDDNDDNKLRHDEKLEKDITMMSKIKDTSGMAHALLEDLLLQEKIISKQLPLDPCIASRSASAAVEPTRRCRFVSSKNVSPSRRIHTHSSSITNQDDSIVGLSSSISTTPASRSKHITLPRYQQENEILAFRADDHILSSASSASKAQTLPNRLDIQRNCDIDSTTNSCYSNDRDQDKLGKTVDGRYAHSTHSAPALMSNPKIYPYEELKVSSKKRLPSDVDRDRLERHLSNDEFNTLFHMTRSEFYSLPEWRQVDLKKRLKLF